MAAHVKEYNSIDMLKFTLAIFVAMIHSGVNKSLISPILRCAVPLFFIISSYFFFSKLKRITEKKERNAALVHLVKRNLYLYLIWTGIQSPLLFFMRGYHQNGIVDGILGFIKDILLGRTFTGSWYVWSLVIGVPIIFLLSKKISAGWLTLLTLPLYIFCCFLTNYYNLFAPDSFVRVVGDGWTNLTGLYLSTGLPVALFWISLGRLVAEKAPRLKTRQLFILTAASGLLLMLERFLTLKLNSAFTDDCYIMLAFVCPIIFLLILKRRTTLITRFRIRELSVLIYVTHGCVGRIVGYLLKLSTIPQDVFESTKLIITVAAAALLGMTVIFIRKHLKSGILKYIC